LGRSRHAGRVPLQFCYHRAAGTPAPELRPGPAASMPKRAAVATRAYANYLQAATDAADQWRKQEVWFPSEFSCVSLSRLVIPGDIHIESIPLRATFRSI